MTQNDFKMTLRPCEKSFHQKLKNPNCKHIEAAQKTFVQKAARIMLVKLTPGEISASATLPSLADRFTFRQRASYALRRRVKTFFSSSILKSAKERILFCLWLILFLVQE